MFFIDLDKLKIVKEYNYHTKSIDLDLDFAQGVLMNQGKIQSAVSAMLEDCPITATCFEINLDLINADSDEDAMLGAVNLIAAAFFTAITTTENRDREKRLDVPEQLKAAKMSFSLLKRAVNCKTKIDCFNLVINYKDLVYFLCDEREVVVDE